MMKILLILMALLLCGCANAAPGSAQTPEAPETAPVAETVMATEPLLPAPQRLLAAMTTEEKVGQLFLARHPQSGGEEDLVDLCLGGYILFGQDFEGQTSASIQEKLAHYRNAAAIAPLIAVDEEGGTVTRVSSFKAFRSGPFPSPRSLYDRGGMEAVLNTEAEKAILLHSLGINVNMAPVCDITTDPAAFMYSRSLGQDPEETGRFVKGVLALGEKHGIGYVLKHFPGYGNNADTHTGIAVDSRSLQELEERDLVPFTVGIVNGCDAILMSHTIITALDEELPASLSPAVHDYLRQMQGFQGVIVTDDLAMGAITAKYGTEEAAVLAVLAGNDLLCSTEYRRQYDAVLSAVNEGRISMERLDEAVLRVLKWKQHLGLIF